jgi:hypothetical protein
MVNNRQKTWSIIIGKYDQTFSKNMVKQSSNTWSTIVQTHGQQSSTNTWSNIFKHHGQQIIIETHGQQSLKHMVLCMCKARPEHDEENSCCLKCVRKLAAQKADVCLNLRHFNITCTKHSFAIVLADPSVKQTKK